MSKKITRTIETHTIYGAEVDMEDGVLKSFDLGKIAMTGCKPTKENAMKELRKRYGRNKNYVVKEIVTDCNVYAMSLEDFLANAVIIDKEEVEETVSE